MDYGTHNSYICQWNAFIRMIYLSYNISGLNNEDGAVLSPHVMFVGHVHVFLCHANLNLWFAIKERKKEKCNVH